MLRPRIVFLALVLLFSTLPLFAQVDTAWVRRYTGPVQNGADVVTTIVVGSSGNSYVTGYSPSAGGATGLDYATIKYSTNGDSLWVRRFNGPGNSNDQPTAMALDDSGNSYVTGQATSAAILLRYGTVKYKPNGDTAWARLFRPTEAGNDFATAIAVDANRNVFVTGGGDTTGNFIQDFVTVKYDAGGNVVWSKRYNGFTGANLTDYGRAVTTDASGNAYVAGVSTQPDAKGYITTIKYAPNGDTLWKRHYLSSMSIYSGTPCDVKLDGAGNVYVAGDKVTATSPALFYDYALLKYDNNGNLLWSRTYNSPKDSTDQVYDLEVDASGNAYVTGVSRGYSVHRYTTIKYAPNGDTLWTRQIQHVNYSAPPFPDIAVDAAGNVYFSGHVGDFPPFKFFTMKYSPNGDSLWARNSDSPGMGDKAAYALGLDGSGNVYVTGSAADAGGSTGQDFITIKYAEKTSMVIQGFSPIDLVVTDPNGDSIGVSFNTIAGASYSVSNDSIHFSTALAGNYLIRVLLDPLDLSGDSTYTLTVGLNGSSAALVTNQAVPSPGQSHTFPITVNLSSPSCFSRAGDANNSGSLSLADAVVTVNYLFSRSGFPLADRTAPSAGSPVYSAGETGTATVQLAYRMLSPR